MNIRKIKTKVFGEECSLEIMDFTKSDGNKWKSTFDLWRGLKMGMRDYKSREPNFPEGLSEVAFCLWSGSSRFISAYGLSNTSGHRIYQKKYVLKSLIKHVLKGSPTCTILFPYERACARTGGGSSIFAFEPRTFPLGLY